MDRFAKLALECMQNGDPGPLHEAWSAAIPTARASEIWAMLTVDGAGVLDDGQLPTEVVLAIVHRALELSDAETLGVAIRMSHFHCAGLVAGDIRKARGQRALAEAGDALRAAWDDADERFRASLLHALAAADSLTEEDDGARLDELVESADPEVRALALMIHAAAFERDDVLTDQLEHPSSLVRLMAAVGLVREGRPEPPHEAALAVLRAIPEDPPVLPSWWVFRWADGPETAEDLAEHMVEQFGGTAAPRTESSAELSPGTGWAVWHAYVWGESSLDDAVSALGSLDPHARFELTCSDQRAARLGLETPECREEHRTRDYELVIASVRSLQSAEGFDLSAVTQAAFPDPRAVDLLPLTVAALLTMATHPLVLTDDDWERLADGFDMASGHPLVEGILAETSAEARERIESILF